MGDGSLTTREVLAVLGSFGVESYPQKEDPTMTVLVGKDQPPIAYKFGDRIARRMIHQLSRKYGIPIFRFYNPLPAPQKPEQK